VTGALEVPKVNLLVQGLTNTLGSFSRAVGT
jgi:hypothetical protein